MEKNRGLWILAIYLFLTIYLLPMFPHGGSANELTRWATAASLVERTSFEIGWTEELIGPNVDTARVGNSVYSNKAPGIAIAAAPIYALTRAFIGPPNESNIRISWFAMRFFFSTLPLLLLGAWLYSRDLDELSLAVLLFASPLFVYSLLFFSHVLVGVLLYVAFRVIYDSPRIFLRNCVLAGFICGFAVISEFPAAIPAAVLGGGLIFTDRRDRFRNLLMFVIGGAPFAIILMVYNNAVFGSPFALSYGYESFPEWAEVAGKGVFGIGVPSFANLYLLLFSPSRGLLFSAPILILSFAAFIASRETKTLRHRIKVATVLVTIAAISGHGAAHGGWAFGARYLVMILPLIMDSFIDGEIFDMSNLWQGFLFVISFVLCTVPALTFPFAPPEFKYPHNNFWGKFLWEENWFAPTMANAFGAPYGIWTIAPAIAMLAAVVYIVWRYARRPFRFFLGGVAGLIAVSVYFALPNLDNVENQFRRATIAERYFRPAERLEKFRTSIPAERITEFNWIIANTRAYAPNDFPYLAPGERIPSPAAELRRAIAAQQAGDLSTAEQILSTGKQRFPFAVCEFSTNLAAIYYTTGRKTEALTELEGVQDMVGPRSRPDCIRSQFMLGSLYKENGNDDAARQAFQKFVANSANTKDPQLLMFRKQLGVQ